jgi:hypothetical protein
MTAAKTCLLLAVFAMCSESFADNHERLRVELLVFRHLDQSSTTAETWRQPDPAPQPLSGIEPDVLAELVEIIMPEGVERRIFETEAATWDETDEADLPPVEFVLLDPDPQLPDWLDLDPALSALAPMARRLVDLPPYDVLLLDAWVQLADDRETASAIDIDGRALLDTGLSGSIRLYQERFAHLEVDLRLDQALNPEQQAAVTALQETLVAESPAGQLRTLRPARPESKLSAKGQAGLPDASPGNRGRQGDFSGPPAPDPVYRLNQARRIRGSRIHYFDHPKFGVIARVTEVERRDLRGTPGAGIN